MTIINITPDSFFDGDANVDLSARLRQIERALEEGADFLDLGAQSTRPGAERISAEEELQRLLPVLEAAVLRFPEARISVDTFYSKVAKESVLRGAAMINDVSAGSIDPNMFSTVAELQVPYVLMHMQGEPQTMQESPEYKNCSSEVFQFLAEKVRFLRSLGVKDLMIDLGFGFGKRLEDNYELLENMELFHALSCPILTGLSRKSMINKVLNIKAKEALNGSTALHMKALNKGAQMLRVHDTKEAKECILLHQQFKNA